MKRLASLLIWGIIATAAGPAYAQRGGPGGRGGESDEVKKLKADLDKLQAVLQDLEAKLQKAKEGSAKKDEPRKSFDGPRKFGLPSGRFGREEGWQRSEGFHRGGFGPGARFGRGPGGFGPRDGDRKGFTPPAHSQSPLSGIEKRLDKIEEDLAELKHELRRKR